MKPLEGKTVLVTAASTGIGALEAAGCKVVVPEGQTCCGFGGTFA